MSIKEIYLQLFMHGMEIHTINYNNIMDRHLKLYGITDGWSKTREHQRVGWPSKKYWFRETKKRRRDEEEKELRDEDTFSEFSSKKLLRSEYQEIRQSIRFGLMREYISDFVLQRIHSYE